MKFRKLIAGAAALAGASTLALAGQANAVDSATPLTFTLANGALSMAAPTTAVALTRSSAMNALPVFSGAVATTVTDERNSLLGWAVTGSVTDFTDGATPTPNTVDSSNVLFVVDLTSIVDDLAAGQTFVPAVAAAGSGPIGAMAVDTNILDPLLGSSNSVSYDLSVSVNVPAGTPSGTYTATLTQTTL